MKIFAISKTSAGITFADIQPYIPDEARKVWQLYKSDHLREFYLRTDSHPGVVLVFECQDVKEVESLLAGLPMVEAGVLEFDLIPVGALLSLEALFAQAGGAA